MKSQFARILFIFLLLVMGFGNSTFAQVKNFQVEFDYASFRYDSEKLVWEFYYAFHQQQMTYVSTPQGGYRCLIDLRLKIMQGDSVLSEHGWKSQNVLADTTGMRTGDFIDRVKLMLEPGDYTMTLVTQDSYKPDRVDSVKFNVVVDPIPEDRVALSDIELALRIKRNFKEENHPFYKNTLKVVPSPSRIYGNEYQFLYFYCETYNLLSGIQESEYILAYYIINSNGNVVNELKPVRRVRPKKYESRVEWGALKVGSLQSGTYTFHLGVENIEGEELSSKEVRFFVYNPDRIGQAEIVQMDPEKFYMVSEFASMPEEVLKSDFEKAIYISKKQERDEFNKLTNLEEKRKWIYRFWKSRDMDKNSPQNLFRAEYLQRLEYTNQNFDAFNLEGWRSDRGRVYIIYGEPDYIHQHPNEENMKPYEVWTYDQIQGGVEFVFADFNMTREYRLVHSSLRGEIQNYEWQSLVRKGF